MKTLILKIKSSKSDETLDLFHGIEDSDINYLIEYAKFDEDVKKYTIDNKRFRDIESFDKWKEKVIEIYTLNNAQGELVGAIWFRQREIPIDTENLDKTLKDKILPVFSIRIYEKARGKGFAIDFMQNAFKHFIDTTNNDVIWLGVYRSNFVAKNLYEKFGFKIIGESPSWHEYIMIYKNT